MDRVGPFELLMLDHVSSPTGEAKYLLLYREFVCVDVYLNVVYSCSFCQNVCLSAVVNFVVISESIRECRCYFGVMCAVLFCEIF